MLLWIKNTNYESQFDPDNKPESQTTLNYMEPHLNVIGNLLHFRLKKIIIPSSNANCIRNKLTDFKFGFSTTTTNLYQLLRLRKLLKCHIFGLCNK